MNTVVVVTLRDIVAFSLLGLFIVGLVLAIGFTWFNEWKNNPNRWWNRKK